VFGARGAPGTFGAMPAQSAQPSAPAPVRAAGLVLTLVATAAGAAGAAKLHPAPHHANAEARSMVNAAAVTADDTRSDVSGANDAANATASSTATQSAATADAATSQPAPSGSPSSARDATATRTTATSEPQREAIDAHADVVRERLAQQDAERAEAARARDAEQQSRRVAMWDRLAACETGGDWHNGGDYGGGLGIYVGTWRAYGGGEFAARPQWATKAQQIAVAERIANDGFGGWGCAHKLGWTN
jgi:hypothetical protein